MIYTLDHKIAFYHVPKTAGASIDYWMQNNNLGCWAHIRPMHIYPQAFEKYNFPIEWSFCVVRNPWERWVSWWYYWKYIAKRMDHPFEEYTEKFFTGQYKGLVGAQYGTNVPQIYYSRYVHEVLRYENLEQDFKKVQDKFKCHAPLKKAANISQGKLHYSHYYTTPRLVDLITEYYKDDIAEYGYTYEV